jgi:outer membrane protein assembly factor BamA
MIALQISLDEGPQYTFEALDWSGNKAVASEDLNKIVGLKVGAPADTSQLGGVIGLAKGLYSTRGYLHTEINATATVDSVKHTALVHLAVNEGPVYHMGKLELTNISANQADLVQRVWSMKPGDVYDATYVKGFLQKDGKELPFLIGWNAQYTQAIHDDTQVVDLSLKFVKQ